ncbi:MAG TPA: hypothetical protein VNJ01_05120 [Bacteriovoracaceae bacterium]|nr:hypothetical protein [Bacteriovoracaceae bacterium]
MMFLKAMFVFTIFSIQLVSAQDEFLICSTTDQCKIKDSALGCFPKKPDNLFLSGPKTEAERLLQQAVEEAEELALEKLETEPLKNGQKGCGVDKYKCESQNCVTDTCTDPGNVCRYGEQDEKPDNDEVLCVEGLKRNALGKCDNPASDKFTPYPGLITEVKVSPIGQCEFKLDDATKEKSIKAMMTIRGMEWMLSTISLDDNQDCFKVLPYLRDEIGKSFLEERKVILKNFNIEFANIEKDFQTLIDAKALADSKAEEAKKKTKELTVIHSTQITNGALASRLTSGYDIHYLNWRKNLLFQSFEKAMEKLVTKTNKKIADLNKGMAEWKDSDKKWKVGNTEVKAFTCRNNGFLGLWSKNQIKKRWDHYYQVSGNAGGNKDVISKEYVAAYLQALGGVSKESAISDFTKGPDGGSLGSYFLVDPLMPGDKGSVKFSEIGGGAGRKKTLPGTGNGSYTYLRNLFKTRIGEFYKRLKLDPKTDNFIYEPELVTIDARDCIQKPSNPGCDKFTKFLDNLADVGFAQFVAYSAHKRRDYTQFFPKSSTWRRRLLAAYEVDTQNIAKYYQELAKHRAKQNECLEKIINGLVDSGILDPTNPAGVVAGVGPKTKIISPVKGLLRGAQERKFSQLKVSELMRDNFSFDLSVNSFNGTGSRSDSIVSSASNLGSAALSSAELKGALAARLGEIKDANARALRGGIDINSKENEVKKAVAILAATGPGIGSSGGLRGRSGSASARATTSSSVSTSLPTVADQKENSDTAPSPEASNSNSRTDITELPESSTQQKTDPTGMSDEEKDLLMANYERTQRDYNASEEDGLFKIVSKAYVRNLGRVLTKKKTNVDP